MAMVARRVDRLHEVAAAAGGGTVIAADVTRPDDCERVVAEAVAALGAVDLVLYAAGTAPLRRLSSMQPDEWQRTLQTNMLGFTQLVQALVADGLGPAPVVTALSSEIVGQPRHGMVAYAVSKAALEEVMRGWRLEHPEVRFCSVGVGATQPTDFGSEFDADELVPTLEEWIRRGLLPGDFMDTDELAALLADVLSSLVAHPGIGVEHLLVRSPAPPMTGIEQLPPQ